jgi:hypothetical protein
MCRTRLTIEPIEVGAVIADTVAPWTLDHPHHALAPEIPTTLVGQVVIVGAEVEEPLQLTIGGNQ